MSIESTLRATSGLDRNSGQRQWARFTTEGLIKSRASKAFFAIVCLTGEQDRIVLSDHAKVTGLFCDDDRDDGVVANLLVVVPCVSIIGGLALDLRLHRLCLISEVQICRSRQILFTQGAEGFTLLALKLIAAQLPHCTCAAGSPRARFFPPTHCSRSPGSRREAHRFDAD